MIIFGWYSNGGLKVAHEDKRKINGIKNLALINYQN